VSRKEGLEQVTEFVEVELGRGESEDEDEGWVDI
jgi:hypothetical protein